jgi:hypothetical protein
MIFDFDFDFDFIFACLSIKNVDKNDEVVNYLSTNEN